MDNQTNNQETINSDDKSQSLLTNIIGQENYKKLLKTFDLNTDFYKDKNFDKEWIKNLSELVYSESYIGGDNSRTGDIFDFITGEGVSKTLLGCKLGAKLISTIKGIESNFNDQVEKLKDSNEIEKRDNKAYILFDEFIFSIDKELSKHKITLQRTIQPNGGESFNCLLHCNHQESLLINFLWHFNYAIENFEGWWDDAVEYYLKNSIETNYLERIDKNYITPETGEVITGYHFTIREEKSSVNNFNELNLKKDVYKAGVMGILAAYYTRDN